MRSVLRVAPSIASSRLACSLAKESAAAWYRLMKAYSLISPARRSGTGR